MSNEVLTGAQAVIRSLELLGVDTVFGLPGGGVGSYNVNDYTFTAQSGGRLKRSGKRSGKRLRNRRYSRRR